MIKSKSFAIFFLFFNLNITFAQEEVSFKQLTIENGLSQNMVTCILKDRSGFMWFGTSNGLNRYDGYRFHVYRNDPKDSLSISHNVISALYEDGHGNLWIGTNGGGLSLYQSDTDSFVNFVNSNDLTSISNNGITAICEDLKGNLWIGTYGGLNLFDRKTFKATRFLHNSTDPASLSGSSISSIVPDKQGNLWIGTHDRGLNLFNTKTFQGTHYRHNRVAKSGISSDNITSLLLDSYNRLWIGTLHHGVDKFQDGRFVHYRYQQRRREGIQNNSVLALADNGDGNIWISIENEGLNLLEPGKSNFTNYGNSNKTILSLYKDDSNILWMGTNTAGVSIIDRNETSFKYISKIKDVNTFAQDHDGTVWIGSDGDGISHLSLNDGHITPFVIGSSSKANANNNIVVSLMCDSTGNLWIGTYGSGVDVFDPKTGTVRSYNKGGKSTDLTNDRIYALLEDKEDIWIGTLGGGINVLDRGTGIIRKYKDDLEVPGSVSSNYISALAKDRNNQIWIGTFGGGVNVYNRHNDSFTSYETGNSGLSDDIVSSVCVDKNNGIWIGTFGGGLNYFDQQKKQFTVYREADGLINDMVRSVVEDDSENIWISTLNGLCKLDPAKKTFKKYYKDDGPHISEFRARAGLKTRDGRLLFGAVNGFNVFHPDSIREPAATLAVALTGFQIFNQTVSPRTPGSPLKKHISKTEEITLLPHQSVFSFEFAALHYPSSLKNKYAYKLEGFDEDWNYTGPVRRATYTNLGPGEYIFRVKASHDDRTWTEKPMPVTIIIKPPYWKTWWFQAAIFFFVTFSVFTFVRIRMHAIDRQKRQLEAEVRERTAEVVEKKEALERQARSLLEMNEKQQEMNEDLKVKTRFLETLNDQLKEQKKEIILQREEAEKARKEAERANQAKSVFLATMSHEIRTPMNGVLGMASLLAETSLTKEQKEYTDTILSSGDTLLTVINDILDFSKIESGNMELEDRSFDLRKCIEELMDLFSTKAGEKGLDLVYQINYDIPAHIVGDSHRLRQILLNLIGNSLKFTHEGEVYVGVSLEKQHDDTLALGFEVRDTGIGIPEDKLAKLFKPFSQADSSTTRKYGGSGLGLVISKRLIELMGGTITAESQPGGGTKVFFTINAGFNHESVRQYATCNTVWSQGKSVLVVDDNSTNLAILKGQLERWQLLPALAKSGAEALAILKGTERFNLVITDMQMPEMDGLQLTRHIKEMYPALPVVLLTSMGDENRNKYDMLFTSVLNKPVKQNDLCHVIETALRSNGKRAANIPEAKPVLSEDFAQKYPLRILVVEDNPVNQRLTTRALEKLGYKNIDIAQNGSEAVGKASEKSYQVILMDVQMPVMDGLEATRIIRREHAHQPIIISMTANAMQEDKTACLTAGMNDYISKPVKLEHLVNSLKQAAESLA